MDALLEKLSPGQIVAIVTTALGVLLGIVMTISIARYQLQSLADETTLKREKLQGELALRERLIERHGGDAATVEKLLAIGLSDPLPDEQNTELAKRFGMLDASAGDIERTLAQALAADPANKKAIIGVIDELLSCEAESGAILAAVRPLCAAKVLKKEPAAAGSCC